jgi:hypothetical protein
MRELKYFIACTVDRISAEIGDEILGSPGTLPPVATEM